MKSLKLGDLEIKPELHYAFVLMDASEWDRPASLKGSDFDIPMRRGSFAGKRRGASVRKTVELMIHGTWDSNEEKHLDSFVGLQRNIDELSKLTYPGSGEMLPLELTMPDDSIRYGDGHVVDIAWDEIHPTHIYAAIDVEIPAGVLRGEEKWIRVTQDFTQPVTLNTDGTGDVYDVRIQHGAGWFNSVEVRSIDFENEDNDPAGLSLTHGSQFDYFLIDTGAKTVNILGNDAASNLTRVVAHDEWFPLKRGTSRVEVDFDMSSGTEGDGAVDFRWQPVYR